MGIGKPSEGTFMDFVNSLEVRKGMRGGRGNPHIVALPLCIEDGYMDKLQEFLE